MCDLDLLLPHDKECCKKAQPRTIFSSKACQGVNSSLNNLAYKKLYLFWGFYLPNNWKNKTDSPMEGGSISTESEIY